VAVTLLLPRGIVGTVQDLWLRLRASGAARQIARVPDEAPRPAE